MSVILAPTYPTYDVCNENSSFLSFTKLTSLHFYNSYLLLIFGFTAIVGDITPSDGVPKEEKSRREREALNEMCEVLGDGMRGIYCTL